MVPVGGYGMAQCHLERPSAACIVSSADTFNGCYPEEAAAAYRPGINLGPTYAHGEYQHNQRSHPTSSQPTPSLMALREQMSFARISQGHRRVNTTHSSQGTYQHGLWTTHGQCVRSADDIESDSGLSLGSSPPLPSPDDPINAVPGYQGVDVGMTYSDGEQGLTEHARRAHIHYSLDHHSSPQSYTDSGAQSNYLAQLTSHTQHSAIQIKQHNSAAVRNLYSDSGISSRGSSHLKLYSKPHGSSPSQAPFSRDERRAVALKIPFPIDKIINLPVDDFNELMTQYTLTDTQMALVRDIRRRGKNKVAAQNCRRRKLEGIFHLEQELNQLQVQKEHLTQEKLEFQRSLAFVKHRLTDLYTEVFAHLRDENGQPYSIDEYSLQQTPDGKIYLVPRDYTKERSMLKN